MPQNFQPLCDFLTVISTQIWARFLSFAQSKLRLYSANHRAGYFSNLACDWLRIVWAYSEKETENRPWSKHIIKNIKVPQFFKRNIFNLAINTVFL